MGEQVKLSETERESLREASPSLGARRASCRRGPLSVPPTSVSSDHLLVFPGTLPNPGTCPCPACLSPLLLPALAQGCELVWPPSSAAAMWKGRHCRRVPGSLGSAAGWPWDNRGWSPGVSGGKKYCPLPCLVSMPLPVSSCVPLCLACMLPCHALGHLLARGCSMSSVLAWPD